MRPPTIEGGDGWKEGTDCRNATPIIVITFHYPRGVVWLYLKHAREVFVWESSMFVLARQMALSMHIFCLTKGKGTLQSKTSSIPSLSGFHIAMPMQIIILTRLYCTTSRVTVLPWRFFKENSFRQVSQKGRLEGLLRISFQHQQHVVYWEKVSDAHDVWAIMY
jgi:hypothetical protein